jgi:hypothetical protein
VINEYRREAHGRYDDYAADIDNLKLTKVYDKKKDKILEPDDLTLEPLRKYRQFPLAATDSRPNLTRHFLSEAFLIVRIDAITALHARPRF